MPDCYVSAHGFSCVRESFLTNLYHYYKHSFYQFCQSGRHQDLNWLLKSVCYDSSHEIWLPYDGGVYDY